MQISGMNGRNWSKIARAAAFTFAALTIPSVSNGFAESAYVAQIPNNVVTPMMIDAPIAHQDGARQIASGRTVTAMPPEMFGFGKGNNLAQTLQIGSRNSAYHLQAGGNNSSTAGIVGSYNNLAVLQAGNNLKSNVVLLNTKGLNVSVIQPQGSAPVNVLIARLPGGGLLIKR